MFETLQGVHAGYLIMLETYRVADRCPPPKIAFT